MNDLINSHKMKPNQYERAQDLYKKASEKEGEKNSNVKFSYEEALKMLKKEIGDDGTKIFEYFQEINEGNNKTIYISVSEKSDPLFGKIYLVSSSGLIREAS